MSFNWVDTVEPLLPENSDSYRTPLPFCVPEMAYQKEPHSPCDLSQTRHPFLS